MVTKVEEFASDTIQMGTRMFKTQLTQSLRYPSKRSIWGGGEVEIEKL